MQSQSLVTAASPVARNSRPRARRLGTATVELAIVLPVLVVLFAAIGDFGRIFHYSVIVTNCARDGALYLSDAKLADKSPYGSVEAVVLADAYGLNPPPTVTSSIIDDPSGLQYADVTVTYAFRMLTQLPGVPRTFTLQRHVRMVVKPSDVSSGP